MTETTSERALKIAVTIDDFVLWDGVPMPANTTPTMITHSVAKTLNDYGLTGTYGFSHTFRLDNEPELLEAFDTWVDAGHHVGNHTHEHAPLRWMSDAAFRRDFETAEKHIGDLIEAAPHKYFRYPMDMCSGSEQRRGEVEQYLADNGYTNAPITSWFSDFAFIVPHFRALTSGDAEVQRQVRDMHVATAVAMLQKHADTAHALFGADAPLIWLVHGTTLARDTLPAIFEAFLAQGVEFVTLDEAMRHPVNFAMPPAIESFSNHLQRFAVAAGLSVPELEYERLGEILHLAPMPGSDTMAIYENEVFKPMAERLGVAYDWDWS
ncbi:polysaccharide deacetylase family protein [Nocardioides sp. WS12]|uniref:polysaccharide deacetylase family protein n=1 Tax=Nocardioides sp. WS12 TaxID=2486272 RepID=UPI0015F84966|nr:polysaccharide deacetylase family protein [Nocardioides sp. WS12]